MSFEEPTLAPSALDIDYVLHKSQEVLAQRFSLGFPRANESLSKSMFGRDLVLQGYAISTTSKGIFVFFSENSEIESWKKNFDEYGAFLPGLFVQKPEQAAAFHVDGTRTSTLAEINIGGGYVFNLGDNSSVAVKNLKFRSPDGRGGVLSWKLPLGLFVTFGKKIELTEGWKHLDALIAHSFDTWRQVKE